MMEHSFTLSGVVSPRDQDPLGIWDVRSEHAVSFSVQATMPEEPTWRVELPDSPADAQAILADKARALELARSNVAQANQELARLIPTAPSFGPSEQFVAQKNALLTAVDELREPVSFGLLPDKVEDQESYRQWLAFTERIRQMIAHYARIETAIEGADIGMTAVGWTGDFETTWQPEITPGDMRAHLQSVHLVLGSRIALLRLASVIAAGAAGLAMKAAIPGAQVLLLPAVWKFVRDVLKELRQSWPQLQALA